MYTKRGCILFIVGLFISLFFVSFSFADNSLEIISYGFSDLVSDQDIEYLSCFSEPVSDVRSLLSCDQEYFFSDVPVYKYNESCYYGSVSVAANSCSSYTIQTFYNSFGVERAISERISLNKIVSTPKILTDQQKWDGSFGTPSQTAYAVWVLSQYGSAYSREIEYALAYLKDSRMNAQKCWYRLGDTSTCSVDETAKTLAYLVQSNLSDRFRIVSDGITYLENQLNYIDATAWTVSFTGINSNVYCNATYGGSSLFSNQLLSENAAITKDIVAEYDRLLNFTCSGRVRVAINDDKGNEIFSQQFNQYDATDFDDLDTSYDEGEDDYDDLYKHIRIKPPCWTISSDKWSVCSQSNTVYALSVGINPAMQSKARTWLEAYMLNHSVTGRHINSAMPHLDTAFYIYTLGKKTNQRAIDWLVYSQNNDGSFGIGNDQIKQQSTAMAILALESLNDTRYAEAISDAKLWLSSKYTGVSTGNLLSDAASVHVLLANAKPYLRIANEGIIQLTAGSAKNVVVQNPSKYLLQNVSYVLVSSVNVTIAGPPVIPADNNVSIRLLPNDVRAGEHYGYISIRGTYTGQTTPREIRRIYFTITEQEKIDLSIKKTEYHAYENTFTYVVTVDSINAPISCEVSWESPYLTTPRKPQVSRIGSLQIPVDVTIATGEIQTSGVLSCTVNDNIQSYQLPLKLTVHTGLPYLVSPSELYFTNDKRINLKIENVGRNPMPVQLSLQLNDGLIHIDETSFIIPGRRTKTIPIRAVVDPESNASAVNVLTISAYDYETLVAITVDVQRKPFPIVLFVSSIMLIALLGVGIYVRMHWTAYGPKIMPIVNPIIQFVLSLFAKKGSKVFKKKIDKKEEYMMGIVSIMKSMDKPEEEIVKRLESEGYSHAQIQSVLTNLGDYEQKVSSIKHEKKVLGIVRDLGTDIETVSRLLKERGYTDSEIRDALQELAQDTEKKEKQMRKDAGISEDEKL